MDPSRTRWILAATLIGLGSTVVYSTTSLHDALFLHRRYPELKFPIVSGASSWDLPRLEPAEYDAWVEYPRSGIMERSLPLRVLDLDTGWTVSFIEPGEAYYGTSDGMAGFRLCRFRAGAGRRYGIRPDVGNDGARLKASRAQIVNDVPVRVRKPDDFRVILGQLKIAGTGLAVAASGGILALGQALRIRRSARGANPR